MENQISEYKLQKPTDPAKASLGDDFSARIAGTDDLPMLVDNIKLWAPVYKLTLDAEELMKDLLTIIGSGVIIYMYDAHILMGLVTGKKLYNYLTSEQNMHEGFFMINPDCSHQAVATRLALILEAAAKRLQCKNLFLYPTQYSTVAPEILANTIRRHGAKDWGQILKKEL